MERKIGEIFTYKDKTYQVLKATDGCKNCSFRTKLDICINQTENCFASYREDKTSVIFKEINNMKIKNNQLTIDIPKGMEIDIENSDLIKGIIKFRSKYITYNDIVNSANSIDSISALVKSGDMLKLEAMEQLMSIARYYKKGWKPNWNESEAKYYIKFNFSNGKFYIDYNNNLTNGGVYFKNLDDAQSVIDNPNFREILETIFKN